MILNFIFKLKTRRRKTNLITTVSMSLNSKKRLLKVTKVIGGEKFVNFACERAKNQDFGRKA